MKSGPAETVPSRSLSCGDMYILLGDEQQNLLKEPSAVTGASLEVPKDSSAISRSPRSTAAVSSDLPLIPSQLSLARPIDGGWGWIVVLGAFFVHVIIDGLCCSFGVLFVELHDYFETSRTKLSLTGALMYAMPMLLAPVSSALIDVYGCRLVGFSGGVISAVGAIASTFTTSLEGLILVFGMLIGLGMSLTLTSSFVVIVVFFERRRTLALALAISGIGFGSVTVPILLEFLLDTYTWRGALFIVGALLLQAGAFCLLFRPVESAVHRRQRLYLRTLENFSRIVGHGDFLIGQDYLKSSLHKQIVMLRSHVSSHPCRSRYSTSHAAGNSTVETLAWPSVLDDSSGSSSSSQNSGVVGQAPNGRYQTPLLRNEKTCTLLARRDNRDNSEPIAPKAEPEMDLEDDSDSSDSSDEESEDPLLQPDALVGCLREIEACDNMPDPESYRILLPDPLLDTIPENAELDLTARVLAPPLGSLSSSSSLHLPNAYDTYLDLSNPQLDDEDEEEGVRTSGRLSYKSLPSERSHSGRLTSLGGSVNSQSLGNLARLGFGSMVDVERKVEESALCRTSSDPELLRRRRSYSLDLALPKLPAPDPDPGPTCWQPLLANTSPEHRPNKQIGLPDTLASMPAGNGLLPPARSAECVPFASIGRLSMALSMPRLHAYSEQSLSAGRRRACRGEFELTSVDLLLACGRCCRSDTMCSVFSCGRVFSNLPYLCLFVSNCLVFCFYNATMFYLGQYCASIGATSAQVALQFTVLGLANFVGQIGIGVIGNVTGVNVVVLFAIMQSLMGVSMLMVPLLTSYTSLFIHTISFGLAISGNDALSTVLSVHFLGLEKANSGIAINLFGQGIANLIGPPLIGAVIEMNNSYTSAFVVSGICLLMSGVVMIPALIVDRGRRHQYTAGKRREVERNTSSCDQHLASDVELV